jgi:hypothetical protein
LANNANPFSKEVQDQLCALLQKECDYHRDVEEIKKELMSVPEYDAKQAFRAIDKLNSGFIDCYSIEDFLRDHGFKATKADVSSIIRRFDVTADARISFNEFFEGVTPCDSQLGRDSVSRPQQKYNSVRGIQINSSYPTNSSYPMNAARNEDFRGSLDQDSQYTSPYQKPNMVNLYNREDDIRKQNPYSKYQPRDSFLPSHSPIRPDNYEREQNKTLDYLNRFDRSQNEKYGSSYDNKYQRPVEEQDTSPAPLCCDDPKCLQNKQGNYQYQRPLEVRRVGSREESPTSYSKYRGQYEKPIEPFSSKLQQMNNYSSPQYSQIQDPRDSYKIRSFLQGKTSPFGNTLKSFEAPEDVRSFQGDPRRSSYDRNKYSRSTTAPVEQNQPTRNGYTAGSYSQFPGGYSNLNSDLHVSQVKKSSIDPKSPYDRYDNRKYTDESPSRLGKGNIYKLPEYQVESPSRYKIGNRDRYNGIKSFLQPSEQTYNDYSLKPSFVSKTPGRGNGDINRIRDSYSEYRGASTRNRSHYGNQRNYRYDQPEISNSRDLGRDYKRDYRANSSLDLKYNMQSQPGSKYADARRQLEMSRPTHMSSGGSMAHSISIAGTRPVHQPELTSPTNVPISVANPNESADKINVHTPKKSGSQVAKQKGAFNMAVSPEIANKSGGGWSFVPSPEQVKIDIDQSKKHKMMDGIQKGPLRL